MIDLHIFQMKVGERATLRITPDYGYGARGAGGVYPLTKHVVLLDHIVCLRV